MDFPKWQQRVFRIEHDDRSNKEFGTCFLIYVEPTPDGRDTAYFATCAHVIQDIGSENLSVCAEKATLVTTKNDDLDIAVVRVEFDNRDLFPFPVHSKTDRDLPIQVSGHGEIDPRMVRPLEGTIGKDLIVNSLPALQLQLSSDPDVKPDQFERGYSGSPVVTHKGVCAVFDARRPAAGEGTYKIGTSFPLWLLPKIWPDMPNAIGKQLFGQEYWSLLTQMQQALELCEQAERVLVNAYKQVSLDQPPVDSSLWGRAITIQKFENPDDPTRRLRTFVRTVAELTGSPSLRNQLAPDDDADADSPAKYRRLIVRIREREPTSRDDRKGRRYVTEVHHVESDTNNDCCCGVGSTDCAPASVRKLNTIFAQALNYVAQSELTDVLAT